ncbi:hypothetical protein [Caldinitratiruptor microaerophilus]|uniref:Uncharacterized protein n=1 Tax=Caldinitratiruptor microaerophilus TaxID=671077 RepID=A0AA35CNX3_9FIRM|nr:hypothetical protein [Caldinitratiruptor microaerophilus]BDG61107.1 hypothetical protein caldi_21970 [Caldinitratiruptor microaerophilus]
MRDRIPHLLAVTAALVLPYVVGRVDTAIGAHLARTFTMAWHLEAVRLALLVLLGFLLAAPAWWPDGRSAGRFRWGVFLLYALPGLVLADLYVEERLIGLFSRLGWVDPLLRGGVRQIGGILAGYGIGQALATRQTPVPALQGMARRHGGDAP